MIDLSLHPMALREWKRAARWYQKRSFLAAERFDLNVDLTLTRIESNPLLAERFREVFYWVKVKRYPYLIYYRQLDGNHWIVIAISHQRRKPGFWLRRH